MKNWDALGQRVKSWVEKPVVEPTEIIWKAEQRSAWKKPPLSFTRGIVAPRTQKNTIPIQAFNSEFLNVVQIAKEAYNTAISKLNDVIILDNNPISYKYNKRNGLPIKSWHYDKNDKELIKIIPLLNFLSTVDDVRKYISFIIENDEINFNKVNMLIRPSSSNKKGKFFNKLLY